MQSQRHGTDPEETQIIHSIIHYVGCQLGGPSKHVHTYF